MTASILAEDDSASIRVAVKIALSGAGYRVTEAANGVTLTPYDPDVDEQLKLGREFMREYRDTFHQLAK